MTNSKTTVRVNPDGSKDYQTIQAAVDDVPLYLRHDYKVNIDAGEYEEDVLVPPVVSSDTDVSSGDTNANLWIQASGSATASDITGLSITVTGAIGKVNPFIQNLTVDRVNPYDDEDAGLTFIGCSTPSCTGIDVRSNNDTGVSDPGTAILSYASDVKIKEIDMGASVCDHGLETKHGGLIIHKGGTLSGTVNQEVMRPSSGIIEYESGETTATAGGGFVNSNATGRVWDGTATGWRNLQIVDNLTIADSDDNHTHWIDWNAANHDNFRLRQSNNNIILRNDTDGNDLLQQEGNGDLQVKNGAIIPSKGIYLDQRGTPGTGQIDQGQAAIYLSDGSGTETAGDLMYAFNDGGTIETVTIVDEDNAS